MDTSVYAAFADGTRVEEKVLRVLKRFAPDGHLDVLACDQDNSFRSMLKKFHTNCRAAGGRTEDYPEVPEDLHVTILSRLLARTLGRGHHAALFNQLGFKKGGFREDLGEETMLLGRLENTKFADGPDGGQVAQLAIEPEEADPYVDGFKTLVKVDPAKPASWEANLAWLRDVDARCKALGKPLFNETLYTPPADVSKLVMAQNLPGALLKIALAFGPFGTFYKTQVPLAWVEGVAVGHSGGIRTNIGFMAELIKRPLLILSAAVDFDQYALQFASIADLAVGPMCGRAYFKDPFSDPAVSNWELLEHAIAEIALPRMKLIRGMMQNVGRPWWADFKEVSPAAKTLLGLS
ncbi:MAG: hypothetical protein WC675_03975 [Patescibacteria group bacterium]|jgi:tagatose-1,6-bisphosphate aldolase